MRGQSDALAWDDASLVGSEITRERTAQPPVTRYATGFPLPMAHEGERLRVVALRAGRVTDRRLVELGITIGTELTLIQSDGDGPLLVAVSDMRLGLGRGMAHKVLVVHVGEGRS